ncbi:hypothetical protein [Nonomuraea soli]|uniref:Uncharacterized protein n=1 Tax=Nonomuraea soli TaxID=1032476 RepID=A0A7W0CS00_9ACTN|nr:hypothetical protein [Nonomuraea soli]MBA2896239.1 hypothetical protein [Nonomuraea soli]
MPAKVDFTHRPRTSSDEELAEPGTCVVCGFRVSSADPGLHEGEIRGLAVEPGDQTTLGYAEALVRQELAETHVFLTDTQLDMLARRAVQALHQRGALRVRRADWRPPRVPAR